MVSFVYCLLFVERCRLLVPECLLFCGALFVVRCSWFVVDWLLCVACVLLRVVC